MQIEMKQNTLKYLSNVVMTKGGAAKGKVALLARVSFTKRSPFGGLIPPALHLKHCLCFL
jgi:hypothetical protein